MPPVVAAAVQAAIAFAAVEGSIIITTLTALEAAALTFATSLALGFVTNHLPAKP